MPDATTPASPSSERSLADQALANLVDQFARPLDFLRELVQNSIDAGSPRIDVWVDHQPGLLSIGVEDHGSGMDEATIDHQLLSLYASTKEDDRTKLGKFGIGFTSVFALRPDRVLVRTGRHGTWWELLAGPDRVFEKHRSSEPISGTQVILFKRLPDERVGPMIDEVRSVLGYWCEHSLVPITFEDRRAAGAADAPDAIDPFAAVDDAQALDVVQRPMALDDAWLQRHTTLDMGDFGTVEVAVGYAPTPSWGFYNGGLTLLRTRDSEVLGDYAPRLGHLAFKVRSDRLEHTLTRDNVRRDDAWKRTLDAVARAHLQLRQALVDDLDPGARSPEALGLAHGQLATELRIDPSFAATASQATILLDGVGAPCTPAACLDQGEAVVAPMGHPLVPALEAEGRRAVLDHPGTRQLLLQLLDLLRPAPFAMPGRGRASSQVHTIDALWGQAPLVDPTTLPLLEQQLLARTQALLAVASTPAVTMPLVGHFALTSVDPDKVRLQPARMVRGRAERLDEESLLCMEGPEDGSVFRRPSPSEWRVSRPMRRRSLLLDVDHPTYILHRTSAHHDLELAAVGLTHAILHAQGYDRDAVATGETLLLLDAIELGAP